MKLNTRARLNLMFGIIAFLTLVFGLWLIVKLVRVRTVMFSLYRMQNATYFMSESTSAAKDYIQFANEADLREALRNLDSVSYSMQRVVEGCKKVGDSEGVERLQKLFQDLEVYRDAGEKVTLVQQKIGKEMGGVYTLYDRLNSQLAQMETVSAYYSKEMNAALTSFALYRGHNDLDAIQVTIRIHEQLLAHITHPVHRSLIQELCAAEKSLYTVSVEFVDLRNEILAQTKQLSSLYDDVCHYFIGRYSDTQWSMLCYTIIILVAILVLSVSLATYTANSITRLLRQGVEQMELCANGNFNTTLTRDFLARFDEFGTLGRAIEQMTGHVREAIGGVKTGAGNVTVASAQLNALSQRISQGTSTQAAGAEEVSSAMEEIAANVDHNATNAQQTRDIAQSMEERFVRVNELAQKSLGSVQAISQKTNMITEIANQTNILALNAAVEAARAGEHGRGFSIVAIEIRKLAERSREAANEIATYSQNSLNDTIKAAAELGDVVPEVKRTAALVNEIAMASSEQRAGVDQINSAVQELSSVIQENATAAEEMAASAEQLNREAETLDRATSFFVVS